MRQMGTRAYWWGFHLCRFIPVKVVDNVIVGLLYTACLFGGASAMTFGVVWGVDRSPSAWTGLNISVTALIVGSVIVILLAGVNRLGYMYKDWWIAHTDVLFDHFHGMDRWKNATLAKWVRVPVSLDRKVLLLDAGIPVERSVTRETRAFSDEDLRVMSVLRESVNVE